VTTKSEFVLTLACPNRPGIVAAVANHLLTHDGDIRDAQQFDDAETGRFFMRVVFTSTSHIDIVRTDLTEVATLFAMKWQLNERTRRRRVLLLVSKFDHCLLDLLYRWRMNELNMEPVGIVSNHPRDTYAHWDLGDIPFHHLPVTPGTKLEQETELWRLIRDSGTELVVLARYMQVLSDGIVAKLAGRCINIHHSFLPSFKGGSPYAQAHSRGVKLIGATAHYVTGDLDEGPIIDQEVRRIDHRHSIAEMQAMGREVERQVLLRAVRMHLEDRIFIDGNKTVVFS